MHHGCRHTSNEYKNHPILGRTTLNPTMAGMDYAGRYRCGACKRLVRVDVTREQWAKDWEGAPRVEPPFPDGYC